MLKIIYLIISYTPDNYRLRGKSHDIQKVWNSYVPLMYTSKLIIFCISMIHMGQNTIIIGFPGQLRKFHSQIQIHRDKFKCGGF